MEEIRRRVRHLRKNPTDAERLLWQKLRFWQVDGLKFRRQQPLGRYIVDFVCLEKRLVVKLMAGSMPRIRITTEKEMLGCMTKSLLS